MLGTPHIWAWHLRHDDEFIHPRSLSSFKTMAEYDASPRADSHANGTIWAAALWDLRTQLGRTEADGVRRTDLMVVQALRLLGQILDTSSRETLNGIRRLRESFQMGVAAMLLADELLHSGRYQELIRTSFSRRGIMAPPSIHEWQPRQRVS
jgi:hypothetical protein